MGKEAKTNAMRILDKNKIPYEMNTYTCDEFIDGCHIADQLGQPYERSFKTLVTVGKSKNYFVFAIPVDKELNLKAAAKAAEQGNAAALAALEQQCQQAAEAMTDAARSHEAEWCAALVQRTLSGEAAQ